MYSRTKRQRNGSGSRASQSNTHTAKERMHNTNLNILVVITASSCGHCKVYKQRERDNLVIAVNGKTANIVEVNLTNENSNTLLTSYHPDLPRFATWYPIFLLFTRSSWDNKKGKLVGKAMRQVGLTEDGRPKPGQTKYKATASSISEWIDTVNREPMYQIKEGGNTRGSSTNGKLNRKPNGYYRHSEIGDFDLPLNHC